MTKSRRVKPKRLGTRRSVVNLVDLALAARGDWMLDPADAAATNVLQARSAYLAREMPTRQVAVVLEQLALTVATFACRLPEEQRRELLDSVRNIPDTDN